MNNYNLSDPYVGYINGNLFTNLYNPYKNYIPNELKPMDEQEYLRELIQIYDFAAHDLNLYLDINPDDSEVIKLRSEYVNELKKATLEYENKYGAIDLESSTLSNSPWGWDTLNWPWDGDMNV